MKGVQCYKLFGGIALKNHTFSFFSFSYLLDEAVIARALPRMMATEIC